MGKSAPPEDAPKQESPDAEAARQDFRKTLSQFALITRAFYASDRRRRARSFFAILIILSLAVGGVQVLMSYAARDFMTAIAERDIRSYWQSLGWYLGSFILAVPIGVYYRWSGLSMFSELRRR